jgi:hypothetical protein
MSRASSQVTTRRLHSLVGPSGIARKPLNEVELAMLRISLFFVRRTWPHARQATERFVSRLPITDQPAR